MLVLLCIDGLTAGDEVKLNSEEISLGRLKDNDIQIFDSEVSRHHCILENRKKYVIVKDLNSRNGFFINEVKKTDPSRLNPKDLLRIGNTTYMLYDTERPPENLSEIKAVIAKSDKNKLPGILNTANAQMGHTIVSIDKKDVDEL